VQAASEIKPRIKCATYPRSQYMVMWATQYMAMWAVMYGYVGGRQIIMWAVDRFRHYGR